MPWYKSPQWSWLTHLIVSVAPILVNLIIAYIQDPSNPLGLNPTVLALVITALNVALSQWKNAGLTVATVNDATLTREADAPNLVPGDKVIVSK